jgi:hypothetical protein
LELGVLFADKFRDFGNMIPVFDATQLAQPHDSIAYMGRFQIFDVFHIAIIK